MTKKLFNGFAVFTVIALTIMIVVPDRLIYAIDGVDGAVVSESGDNVITQDTADEAVPVDTDDVVPVITATSNVAVVTHPACYFGPLELTGTSTSGFDVSFTLFNTNDSADSFTLERMSDGSPFAPVATIGANTEYFTDSGLTPGTTYTYRISRPGVHSNLVNVKTFMAGDANGDGQVNAADYTLIDWGYNNNGSTWHDGDFNHDGHVDFDDYVLADFNFNTQVPAPANLYASVKSGFKIELTWDPGKAFATGTTVFRIERMVAGGAWSEIGTVPYSANPLDSIFNDTTVTPGNSYFYRVQSYTATETSAYSNFVNVLSWRIGDTDGNAQFDQTDYDNIDNGYTNQIIDWLHGEFDVNGVIDFDDYALIDFAYNSCLAHPSDAAPIISVVPTEESVTKDVAYNPTHGVTASDPEDGDLTPSIMVTGSVNIHTLGTYTLIYTVSDSKAHSVSASRTVHVVAPTDEGGNNGNNNNNGGNQGFTGSGSGSVVGGTLGQVLGASTGPSCDTYLTKYIKFGANNDVYNVALLQIFLNKEMNAGLKLDGLYTSTVRDLLNTFQVKYAAEILRPWVAFGLPSETTPTGFVYKTTTRMVNQIACGISLPAPILP